MSLPNLVEVTPINYEIVRQLSAVHLEILFRRATGDRLEVSSGTNRMGVRGLINGRQGGV